MLQIDGKFEAESVCSVGLVESGFFFFLSIFLTLASAEEGNGGGSKVGAWGVPDTDHVCNARQHDQVRLLRLTPSNHIGTSLVDTFPKKGEDFEV